MAELLFDLPIDKTTTDDKLCEENLNRRILVCNREINDSLIEDYMLYILKWNREDLDLPIKKRTPIKLYINSIGGDSFIAGQFCSMINTSDTPIHGVALSMVASAAYHIYISCHKRYAFENSIFLQHDGEVEFANTPTKARDTMNFLDLHEEYCKQNVLNHTLMDEDYYDSVYQTELWMYADKAKELGVVDKIIGIDCKIGEIL